MINKLHLSKRKVLVMSSLLIFTLLIGLAVLSFSVFQFHAFAQNTSNLPEIELTQVASGLERPVYVTHAGDGSNRLFIVEQAGRIRILVDGNLVPDPFLDIHERVQSPAIGGGNEQGLLSVAFPPNYAEKGYFYVYYTQLNSDNVLSRFALSTEADIADPNTEEQILHLPHPGYSNHNGGQIHFGPDGYLYIGTGDGGGGGDPLGNAQEPSSLNGKLLRIDVEMTPSAGTPAEGANRIYLPKFCGGIQNTTDTYAVPSDNPFVGDPAYRPEIWAMGLRNPWRFSFDRQTGDLFIADVGQNRWEEVNFQPADSLGGENYGWNIMEGEVCYQSDTCDQTGLTLPVFVYPISSSAECSVTGGYVYRGTAYPALEGLYIFGDFCSGRIWGMTQDAGQWQSEVLTSSSLRISSFGEDQVGEIYLTDISSGGIYRMDLP